MPRGATASGTTTPSSTLPGTGGLPPVPVSQLTVLAASSQVPRDRLEEHACIGELDLDGRVRSVAGTIAAAEGAARAGLGRVLCPADSSQEAALAGVEAVGVRHLAEAVGYLLGHERIAPAAPHEGSGTAPALPDLADVRGPAAPRPPAGGRSVDETSRCAARPHRAR